jgi:hypothetical protein
MTTFYIVFEDREGRVSSLWINSTTIRQAQLLIEGMLNSEVRIIHYKAI